MKDRQCHAYRISGIVQGVGFRPFVARCAKSLQLNGTVLNDGQGVLIEVVGIPTNIQKLKQQLFNNAPKLARIRNIESVAVRDENALLQATEFSIDFSQQTDVVTDVPPDAVTCPDCLQEIFDPNNRRFSYSFTNCIACGPRYSIIESMPYDRPATTMRSFKMCTACETEYHNIEDRRFHAQPNACPKCGPQLKLFVQKKNLNENTIHIKGKGQENQKSPWEIFSIENNENLLDEICTRIDHGEIVAIKGIGGYHLVCDAHQHETVEFLRKQKHRPHKPFALMAKNVDAIRPYAMVSDLAKTLLEDPAGSIVLLPKLENNHPVLSNAIAPNQSQLGFLLPISPLHHLLMQRLDRILIFTSANLSGQPQIFQDEIALRDLSSLATAILSHDRPIVRRLEDSVIRLWPTLKLDKYQSAQNYLVLRQGRGLSPQSVPIPAKFESIPEMMATGADLKSSIALLKSGRAVLSQYLGDQANFENQQSYQKTWQDLQQLYQVRPEKICTDQHPNYFSRQFAEKIVTREEYVNQITLKPIQHHHAHFISCLVENKISANEKNILGIILDGLGFGDDDSLWGFEFLFGGYRKIQRIATLKPIPLLGGEKAQQEPWRVLLAHFIQCESWEQLKEQYHHLPLFQQFSEKPVELLLEMEKSGMNCPQSHSAGRLFDAMAASIDICFDQISYEGQAAMELESLLDSAGVSAILGDKPSSKKYTFDFIDSGSSNSEIEHQFYMLNPTPFWLSVLDDLAQGVSQKEMACKFHVGLAHAIVQMILKITEQNEISQVALSGGVSQNLWLTVLIDYFLKKQNISLLTHKNIPANDGGIALGQLFYSANSDLK